MAGVGESEADALLSSERLSNDSPVMWPDQQHFCEHLRLASATHATPQSKLIILRVVIVQVYTQYNNIYAHEPHLISCIPLLFFHKQLEISIH